MCILLTRHYKCFKRNGEPVDDPHSGKWIMSCSTPLVISDSINDGEDQACYQALDEQDEWFDHPCPECTGHPAATDGVPVRIIRQPYPHAASDEHKENFSHAVYVYAAYLCRLHWAWIANHWWRLPSAIDGNNMAFRDIVAHSELLCRQDPRHGWRDCETLSCDCEIIDSPACHNLALQRRNDMAVQCLFATAAMEQSLFDADSVELDEYELASEVTEASMRTQFNNIADVVVARNPAVLNTTRPFPAGEHNERIAALRNCIAGMVRVEAEEGSPHLCILEVIKSMLNIVSMDTGLSMHRACAIMTSLGHMLLAGSALLAQPRGWPRDPEPAFAGLWVPFLRATLTHNARPYWDYYNCYLDFTLTGSMPVPQSWNWWIASVHPAAWRQDMLAECDFHLERLTRRKEIAQAGIVDLDPATLPAGAECYICGNRFDGNEAPYDVPAEPRRCAGTHPDIAGRRCLVGAACHASGAPSCPYCRTRLRKEDDKVVEDDEDDV